MAWDLPRDSYPRLVITEADWIMEDREQTFSEKGKFIDMSDKKSAAFYKDMRFWLVVLMLTVFLGFILITYPS